MMAMREVARRPSEIKQFSLRVTTGSNGTLSTGRRDELTQRTQGRRDTVTTNGELIQQRERGKPKPIRRHEQQRAQKIAATGFARSDQRKSLAPRSEGPSRQGMIVGFMIGTFEGKPINSAAFKPRKKTMKNRIEDAKKAFRKRGGNPIANFFKSIAGLATTKSMKLAEKSMTL